MLPKPMRLYTTGIADFERIREGGRIYVDKTNLIFRLSHESQFFFLSRQRRFGKNLPCSTLKYYFQGRKDLFEGLAIAEREGLEAASLAAFRYECCFCKQNTLNHA